MKKFVLPVIHCGEGEEAIPNVRIAVEAGADGVFLINHGIWPAQLLDLAEEVRGLFPDLWIGVNVLGWDVDEVSDNLPEGIQGIWTDACEVKPSTFKGTYFGGVAFKTHGLVKDPSAAAKAAMSKMDVITTSGPGTGKAASVEKVRIIREAIGKMPLALASGVTPENVDGYLPCVDYFLAATGISKDFYTLDPKRVRALVEKVHRE